MSIGRIGKFVSLAGLGLLLLRPYLLCHVAEDGKLTVEKKDVPAVLNTDYAEYSLRTRLGGGELLAVSAGLLAIGIVLTWLNGRRGTQDRSQAPAA